MGQITRKEIHDPKDLVEVFREVSQEQWEAIDGIGPKAAKSLTNWFSNSEHQTMLDRMHSTGVRIETRDEEQGASDVLQGKTFVLTGELERFTRDEAKAMIRKKGGKVSSSVSAKTNFVVSGANPGSKYKKAQELGVNVIDEKQFLEIVNSDTKHVTRDTKETNNK